MYGICLSSIYVKKRARISAGRSLVVSGSSETRQIVLGYNEESHLISKEQKQTWKDAVCREIVALMQFYLCSVPLRQGQGLWAIWSRRRCPCCGTERSLRFLPTQTLLRFYDHFYFLLTENVDWSGCNKLVINSCYSKFKSFSVIFSVLSVRRGFKRLSIIVLSYQGSSNNFPVILQQAAADKILSSFYGTVY